MAYRFPTYNVVAFFSASSSEGALDDESLSFLSVRLLLFCEDAGREGIYGLALLFVDRYWEGRCAPCSGSMYLVCRVFRLLIECPLDARG